LAVPRRLCLILLGVLALAPGAGRAQLLDFPIPPVRNAPAFLVVDQERILRVSREGRDILALNEAEAGQLRAEGQRLDLQFEAEERALSDQRADMDPVAFRALADAFDEKVVATRREQQEKAAALALRAENRQLTFFRKVAPILLEILDETGAAAVVEERILLISKGDLNITEEVITRLDEAYGETNQVPPIGTETTQDD